MSYTTEHFIGLLAIVIGLVMFCYGASYFFRPILLIMLGLLLINYGLHLQRTTFSTVIRQVFVKLR